MDALTVTDFKNLTLSEGGRNENLAGGINLLPDEMLIAIVSKLDLEEAVKTSVLSKRWRYLWQFTSGTIDFDGGYGGKMKDFSLVTIEKFIRRVNHILELHQSPSIENFKLHIPPIWRFDFPIYECIAFAMQKEVVSFELGWADVHFGKITLEGFLYMCREVRPEALLCRLKSVKLVNVNVDGILIEYFISHGPRIENLVLESSRLIVENLLIVGSSLKSFVIRKCSVLKSLTVACPSLKSLDICSCHSLILLQIGAKNLVSFGYHGRRFSHKSFQDVPHLSELEIGGDFCKTFLNQSCELFDSDWLDKIEKLKLCASLEDFGRVLLGPSFSGISMSLLNLKQLELQITVSAGDAGENFIVFPALMKRCPFLSKFVIELNYAWIYGVKDTYGTGDYKSGAGKGVDFEHEGLKVVEIVNFLGMRMDFLLALQLLALAPRLEKMVIHPHTSPGITMSIVRTRARQLEANVPPSVDLVIL